MEAIKFIKERDRMCRTHDNCEGCPLRKYGDCGDCSDFPKTSPERAVEIVEKWSEENPRKTRKSEFLKLFPNATLDSNGNLIITPCALNKELYNKSCEICKYKGYSASCDKAKYWNEEVK